MARRVDKERAGSPEELLELCTQFQTILEMGDDGIMVVQRSGKVEYVNNMVSVITGFSKEELYRRGLKAFLSDESLGVLAEMEKEVSLVSDYRKVCTEMQARDKAGELKECEVCLALGGAKEDRRVYVYMRDITARKQMEREVRTSQEKYKYLFEHIRHGIYISSKEGFFLDCNQAVLDMLGYQDKKEFLSLDITREIYKDPEERKRFQETIEKLGFVKDYEVTFKRKGGEEIAVLLTAQAARNERGETTGYEGMMMDITERKKMERDLREMNEFFNMLIEASPDGIIVTDARGDVIMYNKAAERLLGYTSEEVIGKTNVKDLYPRGLARKIREMIMDDRTGRKGVLPPTELYVKNKAGEVIDISLSASILQNEKGEELAAIGIFKDLREMISVKRKLKETQDQLLQAEKLAAMGRLTSQIAHELNNPLYGIMNTLELLKAEIPETSKRRRLLDMSLSEIVRLSVMLKNMLTFSRPEEEARKDVDMNSFIEGIMMLMEKQLKEADIRLVTEFDGKIPTVKISPNQMRQVILNIVKNAIEAMPRGGTLTLSTRCDDGILKIAVQDTGLGMTDEVRQKIFDAFFTTKEQVRGVGLGLSVCYGIVQDHGGEIEVQSTPGKGSAFCITLPVA
jgi:two-component system NtrC family sensor kinase